ncbi:MAG: hypothetical protein ABSG94_13060 [Brevinematales bacterium]|jgi:hypothetical protein
MLAKLLVIIGGSLNVIWGASHLFPTNSVVKGFGDISQDNKRIVQMEWINEGFTLIFIGLLVIIATVISNENTLILQFVYLASSIMLFSMAILSLFTGYRIKFIFFQLCPLIFSVSGLLIFQGIFWR